MRRWARGGKLSKNQSWRKLLSAREQKEVAFAEVYAKMFGHGTAGHNRLMLIAKIAELLDQKEQEL
jgi:hypothetical protein